MDGGHADSITTEDLYSRGITASAAVGPRLLQRPGGLRELESAALTAAATAASRR